MDTSAGTETTYFVGAHYQVVVSNTGTQIIKYYYAGAQRIAMRTNSATNSILNFLLGDHLGSTSLVTDASGQNPIEMRYKAWGEVRYSSGLIPTDYTYTGQFSYTADFGLMFYNARWYDSSLGRFAQADTIISGGIQGLDRYAYANNSPIVYTDPSGHKVCDDVDANGNCITAPGSSSSGGGESSPYDLSQEDINNVIQAQPNYEHWLNLGIKSVNQLRSIPGWWTSYLDPRNGMNVWKFLLILAYTVEGYSIPANSDSVFYTYMTDSFINKAGDFYKQFGVAGLYLYLGEREAFTRRTSLGSEEPNWVKGTAKYRNTWEFGPGATTANPGLAKADKLYSTAETEINSSWSMILNYHGNDLHGTNATDYGVYPGVSMDGKHVIWELTVNDTNPWTGAPSSTIFVIDN